MSNEDHSAKASRFSHSDLASSRYSAMTSLGATSGGLSRGYHHTNSYWDYLKIDSLLSLQSGREDKGVTHHDEMMFVIVHQAFELWFKLILFELRSVREFLYGRPSDTHDAEDAVHHLRRAVTTLKTATGGFEVMETMDPADFLEFRDILSPASGFQSIQMRQMEIILGLRDAERLTLGGCSFKEAFATGTVDKTREFDPEEAAGSIKEGLYRFLNTLEIPLLDRFYEDYLEHKKQELQVRMNELDGQREAMLAMFRNTETETDPVKRAQQQMFENMVKKESTAFEEGKRNCQAQLNWLERFFDGYFEDKEDERTRNDPGSIQNKLDRAMVSRARKTILFLFTHHRTEPYTHWTELVDEVLQFEQMMLLWRNRHPRMVERQIGRRPGTGGSSGVDYLDATTKYRVFRDLWNIRAMCMAKSKLTPLDQLAKK